MDDGVTKVGWTDGPRRCTGAGEVEFQADPRRLVDAARLLLLGGAIGESLVLRCPRCGWRAHPQAIWRCTPGCGHRWNVFATGGCCPECGSIQTETDCPRCRNTTAHLEWYLRIKGQR